jgi:hypothetical protein
MSMIEKGRGRGTAVKRARLGIDSWASEKVYKFGLVLTWGELMVAFHFLNHSALFYTPPPSKSSSFFSLFCVLLVSLCFFAGK